ncbi:MAG: M15 family metallopeptidase [Gammaproteobacteria bacterium]|nr:M15 family metallopeptidase [Gammaproteobacteria bacterium]
MYDIDYKIPLVDLSPIRKPHYQIPLDDNNPLFNEPMVNIKDYDLPFISWHAVTDSSNAPYGKPIKGSRQEGWLRKSIAEKLERANHQLAPFNAELLILDAYRSIECQRGLWAFFYERGREENPAATEEDLRQYALGYVRDPRQFDQLDARTFPIHITGSSIDVTLRYRDTKQWLNMGSKFEEIVPISATDYFERQLQQGVIEETDERLWNRRLMDWALRSEDFLNDPILYWHYDWGNQIWIKVKNALYGDAPEKAWYGHIEAPAWQAEDASLLAEA